MVGIIAVEGMCGHDALLLAEVEETTPTRSGDQKARGEIRLASTQSS